MSKVQEAVTEYLKLKNREIHPEGEFDKSGRFYLAEKYECCANIRNPSRRFPYSEMLHGRTLKHAAHKYGVDEKECRKLLKTIV